MKRMISAAIGPDTEYSVTIEFCGYIGSDKELYIDARRDADREELLYIVQEDYADDLLDGEVIDSDEDEGYYEVEVMFGGQIGSTETYSVYAEDEADAIYEAIEEAKMDIDVIDFYEL
jgi:hypothetical protein